MVGDIVTGLTHEQAAQRHGMKRTSATMALSLYRRMGYVRDDGDGGLAWTREGFRHLDWLDQAPENHP